MKNRSKKLTALTSAVLLLLSMQSQEQAYAAAEVWGIRTAQNVIMGREPSADNQKVDLLLEDGKASMETELTGSIKVSLISVAMPSDVEFNVFPDRSFSLAEPDSQIKGPSELKVTNHSIVPVRLEISRVDEIKPEDLSFTPSYSGGPEQNFQLVDRISKTSQMGRAILVLGEADRQYQSEADFEQYAFYPGMKQAVPVTEIESGESKLLRICGKISADFYGGYHFTVRPILKISAAGS